MPATETLVNMRTRARQRADQENSTFVTDSELNGYINTYAASLYDMLIGAYGEDYMTIDATFTTVGGQKEYNIVSDIGVSDFYKLRGVDIFITGTHSIALRKFNFLNRNRGIGPSDRIYSTDTRYRLVGGEIHLTPPPDANKQAVLWYAPSFAKLSADGDTFDGVNGWEDYIVLKAARRMMAKEESDLRDIDKEILSIERRIEAMKEDRDTGEPEKVTDVYAADYEGEEDGFIY